MKLKHLLALQRYRRCARIFRHPLRVHLAAAAARRQPLELELLAGGTLRVDDARSCRPMFDWLLGRAADPLPVTLEDGLLAFFHEGRRMALRPSGTDFLVLKEVFADDEYGLADVKGPLDTVLDIGGNIGLFSLRAAAVARRVICVEPVEANLAVARRNFALAGLEHKIVAHRLAVAGQSGKTLRLFLSAGNSGAHSVRPEHAAQWGDGGHTDVATISLADLFEREGVRHCSFLKCDVEGSEFEIFQNTPREVLARVQRIAMEVHLTTSDWDLRRFEALRAQLAEAEFEVEHEPVCDGRGLARPAFHLRAWRNEQ